MSEKKKTKKVFVEGSIAPEKIATSIANHQSKTDITEHSIFLNQVKEENENGNDLRAIEYAANESELEEVLHEIRESAFAKYNLSCLHMYHSLGKVNVGEIYFFVFTSSPLKKEAHEACAYLAEAFRSQVSITTVSIF